MTKRRLNAYIDDLVAGKRPRGFEADGEDAEIARAAIALRAERPGDATPDKAFIAALHGELSALATQPEPIRVRAWHRGRTALLGVAAAVALVGGTVAVTEQSTHQTVQQSAAQVPQSQALRTATFEASSGQLMGQIVVYHGHPSWVFMNVDVPYASGPVRCELHLSNGSVLAAGTIMLHDGKGVLARAIRVDSSQLRNATLSDSSGVVLASARFA